MTARSTLVDILDHNRSQISGWLTSRKAAHRTRLPLTYNVTLTKEQLLRLSDELRRVAEINDVDPHFLTEYVE